MFDATHAKHSPPIVRPLEEQSDRESQRLWYKTVLAIKDRNHELATDEKTKIEDMQREEAAHDMLRVLNGNQGCSVECVVDRVDLRRVKKTSTGY